MSLQREWSKAGLVGLLISALLSSLISVPAQAQLAPVAGTHYAGRASDTGFMGAVNSQGAYGASVPLDFPPARGGLPVPVQIVYGGKRVGAAGLGWDVPLSYIYRDTTIAHHRPGRERLSLMLGGQSIALVRNAADTAWVARRADQQLEVRAVSGNMILYDGEGRTYIFSPQGAGAGTLLVGGNLFMLVGIRGPGGNVVTLTYKFEAPALPGGGIGLSINLILVRYNPSPTTEKCFRNSVRLGYDVVATGSPPPPVISMSMLGGTVLARVGKIVKVTVNSQPSCTVDEVPLRTYLFNYQPDVDTQLPRLQSVTMTGQKGTPEQGTTLPVAAYSYGSIVDPATGKITYQLAPPNAGPPVVTGAHHYTFGISYTTAVESPEFHLPGDVLTDLFTGQLFIDLNGDGRPDFIGDGGQYQNHPNGDATLFAGALGIAIDVRDKIHSAIIGPPANDLLRIHPSVNETLRQLIDLNGDGRLDVVETAALPDTAHWIIHLNKPDPTDPKKSVFVDITIPVTRMRGALNTTGLSFSRVPLAKRTTVPRTFAQDTGSKRTITEFELKDINGDGYPDFLYNASFVRTTGSPGVEGEMIGPRHVKALINTAGVHLQDGVHLFAAEPITLDDGELFGCGVGRWTSDPGSADGEIFNEVCAFEDVNGDGIADRVNSVLENGQVVAKAALGTGVPDHPYATNALIRLPGPLARTETDLLALRLNTLILTVPAACQAGAATFDQHRTRALRDINGDGIPDYVVGQGGAVGTAPTSWTIAMGTGTGFTAPVNVEGPLALSLERSACRMSQAAGEVAATPTGLYDIDGDGQPELVDWIPGNDPHWKIYQLKAPVAQTDVGPVASVPAAGRLSTIDSGYGAVTRIGYKSAKEDLQSLHQVPFPEIVVAAVATTDSGLNKLVSSTRYAYGGSELVFDSVSDRFVFPGYQRTVRSRGTDAANPRQGIATLTDTYKLEPFSAGAFSDAASRFKRYQRAGRVSDVTTIAGDLGQGSDPWALLGTNIANDARRISGAHYNYEARLLAAGLRAPASNEVCLDMMLPYDFAGSQANSLADDQCTQIGFSFQKESTAWRGAPFVGDAFSSTATVKTKTTVQSVDDLGRILELSQFNDLVRTEDDLCVHTVYATPTGTDERVLSAVASRTTTAGDCAAGTATTLASESLRYDGLSANQVADGFLTAATVSRRRTDNGTVINDSRGNSDIGLFDATYDALGNPISVGTNREDGASRTVTTQYDPYGLVPVSVKIDARNASGTALPPLLTSITRDPVTLDVTSTTDPNGAKAGNTFDGFGRVRLSTVAPSGGGASGALSSINYLGFAIGESGGRQIAQKVFTDPVAPENVATAAGRTGTVFLDRLGREERTDVQLGADYANQIMIVGQRTYDVLGRVQFQADPFPSSQSISTAYGTTYHFDPEGTPACFIRGRGQQAMTAATNEAEERYPTCYVQTFVDNQGVVTTMDPASLLSTTPETTAKYESTYSAIGQLLNRSTLTWDATANGGVGRFRPSESMDFTYDRLGHLIRIGRYPNPRNSGATNPISWKYDSLGQVLELSEPDSATQFRTYDNWGELTQVQWSDTTTLTPTDRRTVSQYDALGRTIHSEDRTNNTVDAETVNDYFYDQAVNNTTPPVTATNVLGRLSKAISPSSTQSFSYDGLGRMNASVFIDKTDNNKVYVEKHATHGDGSPSGLDFLLPDTQFTKTEHVDYTYDSAGRTRSVAYADGSITQPVFSASGGSAIDVFGRIRQAQYGAATFTASYADLGRRLINNVKVTAASGATREIAFPAPAGQVTAFDPLGRERGRREVINGDPSAPTVAFSYNVFGQLATATRTPASTALPNISFQYDALGNIGTLDAATGTSDARLSYQSADRDRICSIAYSTGAPNPTCNVKYDGVGNIREMPTRSNGLRTFSYFANGQVKRVSDGNGNDAQFRYDALGSLERLDLTSNTSPDTRHDRHFGGLISTREEIVGGVRKSVITRSIPGPGVVATRHGSAASAPWTFAFGESRGNRFFTNQAGEFVQDVDYQAYGEPTSIGAQPGSPTYSSEQWNGGDALAALGLSQLGARLYDPVIGRFLSRDPLIIPSTSSNTNPYAFAHNDPVNRSDPSGLCEDGSDCPDFPICLPFFCDGGGGGGGNGGSGGGPKPPTEPQEPPHHVPNPPSGGGPPDNSDDDHRVPQSPPPPSGSGGSKPVGDPFDPGYDVYEDIAAEMSKYQPHRELGLRSSLGCEQEDLPVCWATEAYMDYRASQSDLEKVSEVVEIAGDALAGFTGGRNRGVRTTQDSSPGAQGSRNFTVRRFLSKDELRTIKQGGLVFDPSKGNGIPTTTRNFTPRSQGEAMRRTGANNATYQVDFDVSDLPRGPTTVTKSGLPEYPIRGDLTPDRIIDTRKVPK